MGLPNTISGPSTIWRRIETKSLDEDSSTSRLAILLNVFGSSSGEQFSRPLPLVEFSKSNTQIAEQSRV
jgi:hypothetical protein